jgi:phosphoglycerate dehydrogenase-like enzyme
MKPTAFLVNTARGGIVDQDALLRALREGWIAGAGVDVFEPERLPSDHPLLAQPNLVATPHVAFYSEESVHDLEVLAAENVAAVLSGRRPANLVNPEVLDLPRWAHLA